MCASLPVLIPGCGWERFQKCDQQFKCGARVVTQCQSRLKTRYWSLTWNYSSGSCLCTFQLKRLFNSGLMWACFESPKPSYRAKVNIVRQPFCVSEDSFIFLTREWNKFQVLLNCEWRINLKPGCTVGRRIKVQKSETSQASFKIEFLHVITCTRQFKFHVRVSLALKFIHECRLNSRLHSSSFSFHFYTRSLTVNRLYWGSTEWTINHVFVWLSMTIEHSGEN